MTDLGHHLSAVYHADVCAALDTGYWHWFTRLALAAARPADRHRRMGQHGLRKP